MSNQSIPFIIKLLNDNLYGLLNDFVIKVDDEGSFFYFCHGIQNLPYF